MQVLIANEVECAEEDQVSYEIQWTIPNWREVRRDVSLVRNQKAIFETGIEPPQSLQTKWLVGFKDQDSPYGPDQSVRVYLQLLDIKGLGSKLTLDATLTTTLCCYYDSDYDLINDQSVEVSLGESIEVESAFLEIGPTLHENVDFGFINSSGAIQYKLLLTFKIHYDDSESGHNHIKRLKMEQFCKRSHELLCENLATLLNQNSDGDLKIITKDGVELRAYQNILKVQCPVFAGMLNSDLSEGKTGIVKVEDVSGKTMKILLHYFYTGDLLPGWNDPDTIVEFTYAAGKYQVTQILKLLDDIFGRCVLSEISNVDVELLNLCGKLSLKNAEARLLQRIIAKVIALKSCEDLLKLFGCDDDEISSCAEELASEPIGESKVLEILDYAVGNTEQQVDFSGQGFRLLALIQRNGSLKGLERVLLNNIVEITSKFTTGEQLIEFFRCED